VKPAYYGELAHKFDRSIVNENGVGGSRVNEVWMNPWKSNTPVKIKFSVGGLYMVGYHVWEF
jgi:hypothetical protein